MITVEEIREKHKTVYDDEDYLHIRHEEDFDRFIGVQEEVEKGYEPFTDNDPQTLLNKTVGIVGEAKRVIGCPVVEELEEERRNISDKERFVGGCIDVADQRLQRRREPRSQNQFAWYAGARGEIISFPRVYKNRQGNTVCEIDVFDRRWTTFEVGSDGIIWLCNERLMHPRQIRAIYGDEYAGKSGEKISVYTYIDEEVHAVVIGDAFYKDPEEHQCDGCPVVVIPVGSMPMIVSSEHDDTVKDFAESIIAPNRNLYDPLNKIMSARLSMIQRENKQAHKVFSSGGRKGLESDPNRAGAEIKLDIDQKENVELLEMARMPLDTDPAISFINMRKQQGGFSDVAFGQIGSPPPAGITVSLLQKGMYSVINPIAEAVERMYDGIAFQLCSQFTSGGMKPLELMVDKDKQSKEMVTFKPKMVKKPHIFKTKLSLDLAQDEAMKWQNIAMAIQLLSQQTVMETMAGIEDVDLELDKKDEEFARQQPQIRLIRLIGSMARRGAPPEEIMPLLVDLARIYEQAQGQIGGGQQQPPQAGPPMTEKMVGQPQGAMMPPQARTPMTEKMRLQQIGMFGPGGV